MRQTWADLTFVHWAVDPERVAPLLPAGTRPDVLDGATYVGLIPFTMRGAGFGRGPAVPWLGTFLETNVRLYSVDDEGRHGVVFRSLEADRLGVSVGARLAFATPYTWARMSLERDGDVLDYRTSRRWPTPRGAGGRIVVRRGAPIAEPDDLSVFVSARFGLHTRHLGRTWWVPNTHVPWSLNQGELLHLDDDLVTAAGLPGITGAAPTSVLVADEVQTAFGLPRLVRSGR
ncbi:hypothetical protein ASD11_01705 [Aeromicrobium sp. Root495]|nr:hypothetical protein ASD11_01705 [Aeromicrobium sp. Root495]